ncbi:MAG: CIA30 family protein, partial [Planctomycetota bacterium]
MDLFTVVAFAACSLSTAVQSGVDAKNDSTAVATELRLADFASSEDSKTWIVVNDNVMGGRSSGDFEISGGILKFTGKTNTRGGGFSSIRTVPGQWDLSPYDGLALRVRGDGRTYLAEIRTDVTLNGRAVAYRAEFSTKRGGEWEEISLPFSEFAASSWGRDISSQVGPVDPAKVKSLGLMIYDGKDGAFKLEVDSIRAAVADAGEWPAGTNIERFTLAQIFGIPRAFATDGVEQIKSQLPSGQSLPVQISAFASDGSPARELQVLVRWEGGLRALRTDESGSLSLQIWKEELAGWCIECPRGFEIRRAGAGAVEVVTQVIGGKGPSATFESVPDDLERLQVGGLTVQFPEGREQEGVEAIAELSRIRGFVEAYGTLDLANVPYGLALVDTDASNLSGRGLNIPVPLKRWQDDGEAGARLRSVLVHEWVEYSLGVDSGLYVRTPGLRFVGDGIAELYSYRYARRFSPLGASAQLDSYVNRVKKLMASGVETYSL